MSRPPLEVADIVRCAGQAFLEHSRKWINWQHQKVLLAITRCRTAALGAHRDQCSDCGHTAISYNSCRNRHCPRCQGNARLRWLQAREQELLPTRYVHAVFTLPRELAPWTAMRQIIPITAAYLNICTRSPPFKVHSLPRGGFLQVAVSEAPGPGSCDCRLFRGGRFRYSTKTSRE